MAPTKPMLDADELSYLQQVFKSTNGRGERRISVSEAVDCLESMDFIIEGEPQDLVKSVVPAAFAAGKLSLQDTVKVAASAKSREQAGNVSSLTREDSLAELQSSFKEQMLSGEIPKSVVAGEPPPPSPRGLTRDDSLAELESSFHRQVLSGDVQVETPEVEKNGSRTPTPTRSPARSPVLGVDVPARRRSIAGSVPSKPPTSGRRPGPQRADSLALLERSYHYEEGGGPEPELVDVPQKRMSVLQSGGDGVGGLETAAQPSLEDDDFTLPSSPEIARQTSEEELLESASAAVGLDPVQESNVPQKRRSIAVSAGWEEAAAQEVAAALMLRKRQEEAEAEARRKLEEVAEIQAEVSACLTWLGVEAERKFEIARAREDAERRAAEAGAELERVEAARVRSEIASVLRSMVDALERDAAVTAAHEGAERVAAEAAAEVKRVEAVGARSEVAGVLRSMVDSLEKDAAIVEAREEAARRAAAEAERLAAEAAARVGEEAAAREAAERKADKLAKQAEDALRLVAAAEEENRRKEQALREAALEAEDLVAAERLAAAEQARVTAEKQAFEAAQAEEERAEREARLQESSAREAEARDDALREAQVWKEKFEAVQREREQEAVAAAASAAEEQARAVAAAVEEARKFEKNKVLALRSHEEHHSLEGAAVSFENVDRSGTPWWQCLVCAPNVENTDIASTDEDYAAAVKNLKPDTWIKSGGRTASTRLARGDSRPSSTDVCSVM